MATKRIEYIDLAKGICILLVVMHHCVSFDGIEILAYLRMPFYFFISGLFFKDYGKFLHLLVKKTNKLIIPFVFFYTMAWLVHAALEVIKPGFWSYDGHFVYDLLGISYINVPVWFLLCLFWCNIVFYFVYIHFNKAIRVLASILLALVGFVLMDKSIFCPLYLFQSFSALPFFCIGHELRHSSLIESESSWKQIILAIILIACTCLLHIISQDNIIYIYNIYHGSLILYYIKSFMMIVAFVILCKRVKYLPIVSYCGRYSIIILGIHVIYRQIAFHIPNLIGHNEYDNWIQVAFVLIMSIASIPIFTKLFPYFTAQKDLIKN